MEASVLLAESGVHLIDLTMGEDPEFFPGTSGQSDTPVRWVKNIKTLTNLPVMISPGLVPGPVLEKLRKAGADWYACYQETHNPVLFKQLRSGQDYQARLECKGQAHKYGLLTEEGILVGVGETPEDIVRSLEVMGAIDADQVRAMNFVPQEGTPMAHLPPADPLRELLIIAVMRLTFPGKLIPATLDVEGLAGLQKRLEAGANVVTSIVPPRQGLAGVAQSSLDIEEARRTTEVVLPVLEACGLRVASHDEYRAWMEQRRRGWFMKENASC